MNQRSITEGLSRLVRIPALHAGGHGFKSHPLHASHGIVIFSKVILKVFFPFFFDYKLTD